MSITPTETTTSTIITTTTTKTVLEPKVFTHPVRHVEKQTNPQRNSTLQLMQPIDRFSKVKQRANQIDSKEAAQAATQNKKLEKPRLHSGAAIDTPVTNDLTLPPIPEVVWQQPQETHLFNIHKIQVLKLIKLPTRPNSRTEMM